MFPCHRAAQNKQGTNGMLDMNGYQWIRIRFEHYLLLGGNAIQKANLGRCIAKSIETLG